jgi:cytochrome c-type biogenesis protein CcmH/NrfG
LANQVLKDDPGSVAAHYLKGSALKATGATSDALKEFQESLRLSPGETSTLLQLAELEL